MDSKAASVFPSSGSKIHFNVRPPRQERCCCTAGKVTALGVIFLLLSGAGVGVLYAMKLQQYAVIAYGTGGASAAVIIGIAIKSCCSRSTRNAAAIVDGDDDVERADGSPPVFVIGKDGVAKQKKTDQQILAERAFNKWCAYANPEAEKEAWRLIGKPENCVNYICIVNEKETGTWQCAYRDKQKGFEKPIRELLEAHPQPYPCQIPAHIKQDPIAIEKHRLFSACVDSEGNFTKYGQAVLDLGKNAVVVCPGAVKGAQPCKVEYDPHFGMKVGLGITSGLLFGLQATLERMLPGGEAREELKEWCFRLFPQTATSIVHIVDPNIASSSVIYLSPTTPHIIKDLFKKNPAAAAKEEVFDIIIKDDPDKLKKQLWGNAVNEKDGTLTEAGKALVETDPNSMIYIEENAGELVGGHACIITKKNEMFTIRQGVFAQLVEQLRWRLFALEQGKKL